MLISKCRFKNTVSVSLVYESLIPVVLDYLTAQAQFTVLQFSSVLECGLFLGSRLGRHVFCFVFFSTCSVIAALLCLFGRGEKGKYVR